MEVPLIRSLGVKRSMRTALVVEAEIVFQAIPCLSYRVVGMPVDCFVLDAFPESFDEDIIDPAALAIHADPDAVAWSPFFST